MKSLFDTMVLVNWHEHSKGAQSAITCISKIKKFNGTIMFQKDDDVAIDAAKLRLKSVKKEQQERGNILSLTDAYLIATAKREHAKIYATDYLLRDSAREANCEVDFIPLQEL